LSQHRVKRKATAIFNSSELVSIHKDLEMQHKKAVDRGEDCRKILSNILSHKSLDLLGKIQPCLTEIGDRVRELLVRIDESERRKTLEDISPILFRAHHEEVRGKRTEGTCEWILKKEKFVQWEERDSSVTVLYGNRKCRHFPVNCCFKLTRRSWGRQDVSHLKSSRLFH
jgi:hypothetical protein